MSAPTVSAHAAGFGRVFSRADGRDRVGVPFWNGLLSALGAVAISLAVAFAAMFVMVVAIVLITGNMPSTNPGHPLVASGEILSYVAGGWFAWWRLRRLGRSPFRGIRGKDMRALLIGIAVLLAVRIAMAVQLVATHQTKHVQSGFEHFDVVSKVPNVTMIGVVLTLTTMIVAAPLAEELIFRGLLFGALAPRIGVLASALLSAVVFGAVHGDLILFPTLAALGFVSAIAYAATGNLWIAVTLHALNNALGAVFLIGSSLHG